jgi:hypothetical protein
MYRFGTSTATIQLSRIRHVFRPALSKALNLDSNLHKRIQQPADAMAKTQIARLVIRVLSYQRQLRITVRCRTQYREGAAYFIAAIK